MTVNILSTSVNIQWEEPQWDVRGITRGVEVNCTDGSQYISELHNISDFEVGVSLRGTNLNVPVNCCHIVLTTEGNGPQKCAEYKYTSQIRQMANSKFMDIFLMLHSITYKHTWCIIAFKSYSKGCILAKLFI